MRGVLRLLLVSSCLVAGCTLEPTLSHVPLHITDGARHSGHPAVGAVIVEGENSSILLCTGTLIGYQTVLTAAHCVETADSDSSWEFVLGENAREAGSSFRYPGAEIAIHPDFSVAESGELMADLAVLTLATDTAVSPLSIAGFSCLL